MDYSTIINEHPELFDNKEKQFEVILDQNEISSWQNERRALLICKKLPQNWANIGIVLDDPYVIGIRDLVEFSDKTRNGYIRFYGRSYLEDGSTGVVVLPELNGKFLIIEHFRHATRSWHWEIPRGFGEAGNNPETQARKELKEEIGVGSCTSLDSLGTYFDNTGIEGDPVNLFLAKIPKNQENKINLEKKEGIRAKKWVTLSDFEKMIANDEINDGFTIAAYSRAKLKGLI